VGRAADYAWSSAHAHSENAASDACIDWWSWDELGLGADWAALLEQREADAAELRVATYAGLPCGEPDFVQQRERAAQRTLRRLRPGRKSKTRAASATTC
jgi:hypothetical protein